MPAEHVIVTEAIGSISLLFWSNSQLLIMVFCRKSPSTFFMLVMIDLVIFPIDSSESELRVISFTVIFLLGIVILSKFPSLAHCQRGLPCTVFEEYGGYGRLCVPWRLSITFLSWP